MSDVPTIALVLGTFVLAGTIKGVIGLGLPTVALALLTFSRDLPTAMSLLLAPSLVTNVWQASVGAGAITIFRRLAPFLFMATVTVWVGALALTRVELPLLSGLLGVLLILYAVISLAGFRMSLTESQARWAGPLLGAVNGVLTGMTGSFAFPGVLYLQGIGLSKDSLIQAMGMLFTVSTLALAVALQGNAWLTLERATLSAAAVLPALLGMWFGQRIRQRLTEHHFRRLFFIALILLGASIIGNAGH